MVAMAHYADTCATYHISDDVECTNTFIAIFALKCRFLWLFFYYFSKECRLYMD